MESAGIQWAKEKAVFGSIGPCSAMVYTNKISSVLLLLPHKRH